VHICLFLHHDYKIKTTHDVDRFISAEIPNPKGDPEYYELVKEFMMHGPCGVFGPKSPCMIDNKCSKHFPKKYAESTTFDDNGFATYMRRNNGRCIKKNDVELDNRYVVPHNKYLLKKYKAHINIEWCNQFRSIKYLFKYMNKGSDRTLCKIFKITRDTESSIENLTLDEIKEFYDCRYLSNIIIFHVIF